jgi:PAS domain S-box-containing protein
MSDKTLLTSFLTTDEVLAENKALHARLEDAEKTLRASEERFHALTEASREWIWEVDLDGVYTYASPKVRDLLGYQPEDVVGKTPFDFMPPEEASRIRAEFQMTMQLRRPFAGLENVNLHKDGQCVILETGGMPITDGDGRFCGFRGTDRDVTERKKAEQALRESERRLRALAGNLPGVVLYQVDGDANGNRWFSYVSDSVRAVLGVRVEDVLADARALYSQVLPEFLPGLLAAEEASARDKGKFNHEFQIRLPSGEIRWLELAATVWMQPDGRGGGSDGILMDITSRKEAAEEIARLKQSLEQLTLRPSGDGGSMPA